MSIQNEIDRVNQNVANTYAVLSALGADLPDVQNSDNLATTAGSAKAVLYSAQTLTEAQKAQARENIGVTADGDTIIPPLKIYAKLSESGASYTQEIIEGGAAKTYTAAEIHDLVSHRIVTVETYTDINTSVGRGLHQYFETTYASDGTVNQVVFRGVYVNALYKLVPAYVTINHLGNVFVSDAEWAGNSVETDTTLTKNGYPADAKKVGDKLTALADQIANSGGTSGGASINVTAEVGQTIVVKEVDADGKPTAWEAADYQPRTHWSETTEVLPETTYTLETFDGTLPTIQFIVGNEYIINFNSVEYISKCISYDGMRVIGNTSIVIGDDNGCPFFIYTAPIGENGEPVTVIQILNGEALGEVDAITLSITEIAYHTLPEQYVPCAFPYYIEVIGSGTADDPYVCNDTVANVNAVFESGRPLIVKQITMDTNSNQFVYHRSFSQRLHTPSGIYVYVFGVWIQSSVNTTAVAVNLTSQDDGTFAVSTGLVS